MKKCKRMIRFICALNALLFVLCMLPSGVSATSSSTYILGDVNCDGRVKIRDCTYLQMYLGGDINFNETQKKAADVNLDGRINIRDVTYIQAYLVRSIDSFYSVSCNKWTSLYKASTKEISLNADANCTISVSYINGSDWLQVQKNGKTICLTTSENTSGATREANVLIKIAADELSVNVKQLCENEMTGDNRANYNCYAYALQLTSDPRLPGETSVPDLVINPGTLANPSLSKTAYDAIFDSDMYQYNIINYSIKYNINNSENNIEDMLKTATENMFKDAEDYIIDLTRDDLETLGWGIKKVTGDDPANAKVADGNWLVALSFDPKEMFNNGIQSASIRAYIGSNYDHHWYRRVDNPESNTSHWTQKLGTMSSQKEMDDIPENTYVTSGYYAHKVCSMDQYREAYADYAIAFMNEYNANKTDSFDFYYYRNADDLSAENEMINAHVFLGYYEVGPNVE